MNKIDFSTFFESDIRKIALGVLSVALVIYLYTHEIHWFNNTFNVAMLLWIGVLLGLVTGAWIGWKLKEKGSDLMEQFVYMVLCLLIGVLLFPLLLSLTNRLLSPFAVSPQSVEFVQANAYIGSRFGKPKGQTSREDGFHVFFIRNNKLERIKCRTHPYPGAQKGEIIDLPVKRGLLGFEIVCLK